MSLSISLSPRIRKSPFFEATVKAGAKAFSVYNKTYLPIGYQDPEAEFWKLVNDVTLWDVACQRVTEIARPDAFAFMDRLTPRDMTQCRPGQCKYVLLTDQYGGIINDPVLLQLDKDKYWLSASDNDIQLWAKGIAVHAGLDVHISEPEVATLQLQGPKSAPLIEDLFGPAAMAIKYYEFIKTTLAGSPVLLARTGWSAERGYEIYVLDTTLGPAVWDRLLQAGKRYGIIPAVPSRIRRIEAGILDYNVDMDSSTNPFEIGMARGVALNTGRPFIGKEALLRIQQQGLTRLLVGVEISGPPLPYNEEAWPVFHNQQRIGKVTSCVYSPRLQRNIGFALVALPHTKTGTKFMVETSDGPRSATVVAKPFVDTNKSLAKK